jgi:hypothetical protein
MAGLDHVQGDHHSFLQKCWLDATAIAGTYKRMMGFPSTMALPIYNPSHHNCCCATKESAATFHQQQLQTCVGVGEFFRDHVLASFGLRSFPQRKMQSPEDCPFAFGLSSQTFSDLNVQVYKTAVHCKMMRLQFPFPQ